MTSYTSENILTLHKPKCENIDITIRRTSPESHIYWKNHYHKSPIYSRINAVFEADNETDDTSVGHKTTKTYKQNPVLSGYHIESELEDVLKSDYYKSP